MPGATPVSALSVIGFFLTLVGLLGSFFYIHLSDWYREVMALAVKWRVHRYGDEREQKAGRRECRYEAEKLASPTVLVTSVAVTLFVLVVSGLTFALWLSEVDKTQAWVFVGIAGGYFLLMYLVLTGWLLAAGYSKARTLRGEIADVVSKEQK